MIYIIQALGSSYNNKDVSVRINNVIIVGPLVVDLRVYVHYYTKEFYVEL